MEISMLDVDECFWWFVAVVFVFLFGLCVVVLNILYWLRFFICFTRSKWEKDEDGKENIESAKRFL